MDRSAGRRAYLFGDFRLDATQRLLMLNADGRVLPLTARTFDTLLYFVQHRGELLDKAALMSAIWPNVVVEENNLNQNISTLRRILGDSRDEHRFIVTVPNRGYRFVADVSTEHDPQSRLEKSALVPDVAVPHPSSPAPISVTDGPAIVPDARRAKARVPRAFGIAACTALVLACGYFLWGRTFPTITEKARTQNNASMAGAAQAIAVLPFADMSPNKDQEYFADGLSEELSDHLSRLTGLRVIGRSSAFSFKGKNQNLPTIGKILGVNHILEGSVRKDGERLRITAQLVDSNGTRVWFETYDQALGDVFTIQDEVANSVAAALSVTLATGRIEVARGGTRNVEAYDAYLAGKAFMIPKKHEGIRRGVRELERAVTLDPQFALAWSELALSYMTMPIPERNSAAWNARALEASARALEIAPDLPSVLSAAAMISTQRKDWAEAERQLKKARELATGTENVWKRSGLFLLDVGRPREATEYFRRAALTEPLISDFRTLVAEAYEASGDLDQAAAELARSASLVGDRKFVEIHMLTQAIAHHDLERIDEVVSRWHDAVSVAMRAHLGEPPAALAQVRRFAQEADYQTAPEQIALAHWAAYFGDPELSLRLLRKVSTDAGLAWWLWRPMLKETRRLPGFKDVVRDLGLVAYWRASGNWGEFCRPLGAQDFECT
jgi:TolB-like protein/DNA-binding winged helix-turn-helix (wHTH) protein